MSEAYIGEIRAYGFNFAPSNWMLCNGQTLAISQYTALFSVIGTFYGGNGTSTFQLPNLQGQIPMHWGTGSTTTVIGEVQGQSNVTLSIPQMPAHTHTAVGVSPTNASERTASPNTNNTSFLAASKPGSIWQTTPTIGPQFASNAISMSGNSLPHDNMQPYLTISFCICFNGVFPTHS